MYYIKELMISICFIIGDIYFGPLVKGVPAKWLHYKVTILIKFSRETDQ